MTDFEQVLGQIAAARNTTIEQIRIDMQEAMEYGMSDSNPAVRARWASIPKKGNTLTLEEFVRYLARLISSFSA